MSDLNLPVYEYYDKSPEGHTPKKGDLLRMAHGIYVFCRTNNTDKIIVRNLAKNFEIPMEVNMGSIKEWLEKEGLIN